MGLNLAVAVEVYDEETGKWVTITREGLRNGVETPYNAKKAAKEARAALLKEDPDFDPEDLEAEAANAATGEYTIHIPQDYDLFYFIANAKSDWARSREIFALSGFRGLPLDSPDVYKAYGMEGASFLTLSELLTVDWKQNISEKRTLSLKDYSRGILRGGRGHYLAITEKEWLAADDAATKQLARNDLYIKIDKAIYLKNIGEFLEVIDNMKRLNKEPNLVRLIMLFTS